MRRERTEKQHAHRVCHQQGREGFDIHLTHQTGVIFNVQPRKLKAPKTRKAACNGIHDLPVIAA